MPSAQVFVSYSHLDRQWLDPKYKFDLIPWLAYSLRREGISFWYDRSDERGLQGGDRFQEEIERAIDFFADRSLAAQRGLFRFRLHSGS